ncbi:hypothetical protein OIDMADRAFT_37961 [Oidiodendron maius Zn]|uniref:Uncharacterized protein n=1 Tax=Oidiodendron maius (strain Zn) TaxID=913774 RepID=A0A0C3DCH4_OIDMZ|nr:hypothetical protein OIDMADRAFT_37961 [Oidiodendron maius Zn]
MQLSAFLASTLLLAIPGLVSAAPTDDACSLAARDVLSARAPTCNPPKPNAQDAAAVKKYDDLMAKMSAATKAAHTGSCACPASKVTDFQKSKDKNLRTTIKTTCVNGYQTCVTQRKAANTACTQLGGTVDQGHLTAVQVCQTQLNNWKARVA